MTGEICENFPGRWQPRSRRTRLWSQRLGASLAGSSVAILLAMAALWLLGCIAAVEFVAHRAVAAPERGTGRYAVHRDQFLVGSGSGVVALGWYRTTIYSNATRAQAWECLREFRRRQGRFQLQGEAGLIAPHGEAAGPWHSLRWSWRPTTPGGLEPVARFSAAAPCWVVMLPWIIPPVWWLWCPPGRALPRLTTRRLAAVVAVAALISVGLAALWRASATDRALDPLDRLGGQAGYRKSVWPIAPELVVGLTGYAVDDAALAAARLDRLPDLRSLDLSDSRVTDAGLAGLAALTGLEELVLIGDIGVTDAGLAHLSGLTRLRKLDLHGTRVTPAGVARLRRALPHAEISD